MFTILAITSRFQEDVAFNKYCEKEGLDLIRATLYSSDLPTLDILKATVVHNAWLGKVSQRVGGYCLKTAR